MTSAADLDLPLVASGKVREIYALEDDRLLLVASDRISTYDVVHPNGIPDKGKVLTGISVFWFNKTGHIVPNHYISATEGVPDAVRGRGRNPDGKIGWDQPVGLSRRHLHDSAHRVDQLTGPMRMSGDVVVRGIVIGQSRNGDPGLRVIARDERLSHARYIMAYHVSWRQPRFDRY